MSMWFIEALQPADGMVFVSERLTRDGEPTCTYYAAAPEFRPVPVRNRATALWATRGTFQERLFRPPPATSPGAPTRAPSSGPGGSSRRVEIAFPSLAQALELARRVYLASGPSAPPSGSSGPTVPPTNPGLGPSLSLAAVLTTVDRLERSTRRELAMELETLSTNPEHLVALRRAAVLALAHMPRGSEATLEPEERRIAVAILLDKSGLWDGFQDLREDWHRVARTHPQAAEFPRWQGSRVSGSGAAIQRWLLGGLLFHVPAPVSFPPYLRGLPTLGHHMCAGLADREFWRSLSDSQRLIPLQLAGLLLAASTVHLVPGSIALSAPVMRKANHWLANHAPDRTLAEIRGAEATISNLTLTLAAAQEATFARVEAEAQARAEAQSKAKAEQRQKLAEQKLQERARELEQQRHEQAIRGDDRRGSSLNENNALSSQRPLQYPNE